jgi:hypothetical protein
MTYFSTSSLRSCCCITAQIEEMEGTGDRGGGGSSWDTAFHLKEKRLMDYMGKRGLALPLPIKTCRLLASSSSMSPSTGASVLKVLRGCQHHQPFLMVLFPVTTDWMWGLKG